MGEFADFEPAPSVVAQPAPTVVADRPDVLGGDRGLLLNEDAFAAGLEEDIARACRGRRSSQSDDTLVLAMEDDFEDAFAAGLEEDVAAPVAAASRPPVTRTVPLIRGLVRRSLAR